MPANIEDVTASLTVRLVSPGKPFYWLSQYTRTRVMNFWLPRYRAKRVPAGVKNTFSALRPPPLRPDRWLRSIPLKSWVPLPIVKVPTRHDFWLAFKTVFCVLNGRAGTPTAHVGSGTCEGQPGDCLGPMSIVLCYLELLKKTLLEVILPATAVDPARACITNSQGQRAHLAPDLKPGVLTW